MPTTFSSASFDLTASPDRQPQASESGSPDRFNIVVLGDFSGRANRGVAEPLNARKLVAVDVDNFGRVFAQLGAKLKLTPTAIPEGGVELAFSSLDDFHPDRLLAKARPLAQVTEARRLLLNPSTAEQGRAALQAYPGAAIASPASQSGPAAAPTPESDDDTMARLLGGAPPPTKTPVASPSQVEQFIRQVVAPHVSPGSATWQSGAVAAAEMELATRLDAILHHPDFQALEAAWRGADMLVRRIESPEEIGLLVLDVSLAELQADLTAHEQAEQTALFRLLRDRKPSLLAGNYTFGHTTSDLCTLGKLGEIAARLAAPFVATASSRLVGCDSFALHPDPDDWKTSLPTDVAEVWETLRQTSHARHVGLAAPRFLVRQPYGKAGDAVETFPFEELPGEPAHELFLWGHPAVLCACAVVDALQAGNMELAGFTGGEIGDLPVHKFTEDGEVVIKPYAEAWLTDRAVDRILSRGVIPIVPMKNQNSIRLISLRSIARESAPLPIG